ncbi:hypothetical protein K1719_029021 [Acacia pycnantha]|nr:hypothetical protein K1719_029021 [Acacia pycnantha]
MIRLSYCCFVGGFDSLKTIPSEGRSGGIAVLWRSVDIKVGIVDENRQYIHMQCAFHGSPPFFLSAVYAIPHSNLRSVLWSKMRTISGTISTPWVVYEDFNDILLSSERRGGARCNVNRLTWFNDKG